MYDEGLVLTGAMRVADGAVIHRDFYANYGPGQFYALAGVFKVLGQTVLAERVYDGLVKAGIACFAFVIAQRLTKPPTAIAVTGFCIVLLSVLRGASYPIWPGFLFVELALPPLLSLFEGRPSFAGLVWSGFCVGVVTVFRYDMGFFACAAITTVLLVFAVLGLQSKHGALIFSARSSSRSGWASRLWPSHCLARLRSAALSMTLSSRSLSFRRRITRKRALCHFRMSCAIRTSVF